MEHELSSLSLSTDAGRRVPLSPEPPTQPPTSEPHSRETLFSTKIDLGRPSVIRDYCRRAIYQGKKECLWICMRRGGKWIAKDVRIENHGRPFGAYELRKECGWWKRHSLYSATAAKEIRIRLIEFDDERNEIQAVPMSFDHTSRWKDYERGVEDLLSLDFTPWECGIDIMGHGHGDHVWCANNAYDKNDEEEYCKVQRLRELRQRQKDIEWMPSMLEHYWQHGIGSKGVEFLKSTGFIMSYESLLYDQFSDAANPYGKIINAFEVIEGWHLRYLLTLCAGSVFSSVCVVAICTIATKNLDASLTAGSYTAALAAVFIAILTLLSVIL